jgi:hypothetical protein
VPVSKQKILRKMLQKLQTLIFSAIEGLGARTAQLEDLQFYVFGKRKKKC